MKVKVTENVNIITAPVEDVAAYFKLEGYDRRDAWGRFVIARVLKPGIDAKEFMRIFDGVEPANRLSVTREVEFTPTHYDRLRKSPVMVYQNEYQTLFVWQDGSTGGQPLKFKLDAERYEPL